MAPEQIEHPLQVDHRADIYSLGVVFYQMLTGELPIGRFAPPSKKVQIDVRLDEVVLRALEKEPEQRYQHASEIKTQVESIVTTPDASASAAGQVPLVSQRRRGVPLVAVRDGQKIIHWPGVCLFVAVMIVGGLLAVVLGYSSCGFVTSALRPGPQMGANPLLPLYAFFLILSMWAAWAVATVMLVVRIRERLALPVERLPHLDGLGTATTPPADETISPHAATELIAWVRRRLRGPALGLLVTGIANLLAIYVVVSVQVDAFKATRMAGAVRAYLIAGAVFCLISVLQLIASFTMARPKWYRLAVVGSILAIIISPGNLIGLPIGIWALVVLSQRDVRAAFGHNGCMTPGGSPVPPIRTQRMTGIIALVLCLAGIPISLLGGAFASWNLATVLVPVFLIEITALVLGIAGRKSSAGKIAIIGSAVLLLILAVWPMPLTVEAKGTLEPVERRDVFANIDGVVEELKVDHGDHVAKGQLLVKLRNTELEATIADIGGKERVNSEKLSRVRRELFEQKLGPEVRTRLEGEQSELIQTQESLERQLRLLKDKQSELEVRSPLDGVVLTWDLHNRLIQRPVQKGQVLLRVADPTGPYQLELHIPKSLMGDIAEGQAQKASDQTLPVTYIIATAPGITHQGRITEIARHAEATGDEGNTVLMKVAIDKVEPASARTAPWG